jgi:hypothetical protein
VYSRFPNAVHLIRKQTFSVLNFLLYLVFVFLLWMCLVCSKPCDRQKPSYSSCLCFCQYWSQVFCVSASTGLRCFVFLLVLVSGVLCFCQYWSQVFCVSASNGLRCFVFLPVMVSGVLCFCQYWSQVFCVSASNGLRCFPKRKLQQCINSILYIYRTSKWLQTVLLCGSDFMLGT